MKFTIEGFSQEYALTLQKEVVEKGKTKRIRVDCNDLVILRWFVDFYPKMMKVEIEGKQYAWIKYQALLEDLPLLDIKKRMLFDRLQKLVDFGILSHKSIKSGGSFSYYGFGDNYIKLVDNSFCPPMQKIADGNAENCTGVSKKLQTGVQESAEQIDSSIKNTSIKDSSIKEGKDIDPPEKKKFKVGLYENVLISNEEITKLVEEFGETDTREAIEYLSEYINFEKNGVYKKSHFLAIKNWVVKTVIKNRLEKQEIEQREKRAKEIEAKQKEQEDKLFFNGKRIVDLTQAEYEEYCQTQNQRKPAKPIYNWLEPHKNTPKRQKLANERDFSNVNFDEKFDDLEKIEV